MVLQYVGSKKTAEDTDFEMHRAFEVTEEILCSVLLSWYLWNSKHYVSEEELSKTKEKVLDLISSFAFGSFQASKRNILILRGHLLNHLGEISCFISHLDRYSPGFIRVALHHDDRQNSEPDVLSKSPFMWSELTDDAVAQPFCGVFVVPLKSTVVATTSVVSLAFPSQDAFSFRAQESKCVQRPRVEECSARQASDKCFAGSCDGKSSVVFTGGKSSASNFRQVESTHPLSLPRKTQCSLKKVPQEVVEPVARPVKTLSLATMVPVLSTFSFLTHDPVRI